MLQYVRFDTTHFSCDCCGRVLKAGSVVLSDDRHYGRDCAARALGRPKATVADRKAVDALEEYALRANFTEIAPRGADGHTREWAALRFYKDGRIVEWVAADGAVWAVYAIDGARLVAHLVAWGGKTYRMPTGYRVLAIGSGSTRFVDVAEHPVMAAAVAEYRRM